MKRGPSALLLAPLLLMACGDEPVPKPKGWPRLDLPPQAYSGWQQEGAPFTAELPTYARMAERNAEGAARWYDLRFAGQRATMHLTYSPVQGNLPQLIDDAHAFKRKHELKATRIRSERAQHPEHRVYGTLFDVEGDAASPFVFYLTDSTNHFLYGALYFDARPNADSLAPVTARLRADMRHLAATLRWGAP